MRLAVDRGRIPRTADTDRRIDLDGEVHQVSATLSTADWLFSTVSRGLASA